MFGRPAMGAKVFRSEAVFFNVEKRAAYPLILIANNYIHLFKCLFIYVYVLTLYALSLNIEIKFVLICWTTGFDLFSLFHTVQIRTTIIYWWVETRTLSLYNIKLDVTLTRSKSKMPLHHSIRKNQTQKHLPSLNCCCNLSRHRSARKRPLFDGCHRFHFPCYSRLYRPISLFKLLRNQSSKTCDTIAMHPVRLSASSDPCSQQPRI